MMKLTPGQLITFKPSARNTGAMTFKRDDGKTIVIVHPDGTPMQVSDLKPGQEYEVDIETGVVKIKT